MPGLGLDGLQGHAGLAQAGETGVAQLVAGAVRKAGALLGVGHDLVQAVLSQPLATRRTLQGHEQELGVRLLGPFGLHIERQGAEEPW